MSFVVTLCIVYVYFVRKEFYLEPKRSNKCQQFELSGLIILRAGIASIKLNTRNNSKLDMIHTRLL